MLAIRLAAGTFTRHFMRFQTIAIVMLAAVLCGCDTPKETKKAEKKTPYDKPLTSLGAKFGALPPTVQATVLAEAGGADIVDADRETTSGRVVYKITFREPEIYPTLYVAPDGSVLNPDLSVAVAAQHGIKVKTSELPEKVKKLIEDKGPTEGAASIHKETWGDRTVYIVKFRDEAHYPKMFISSDGTVLEEGQ